MGQSGFSVVSIQKVALQKMLSTLVSTYQLNIGLL